MCTSGPTTRLNHHQNHPAFCQSSASLKRVGFVFFCWWWLVGLGCFFFVLFCLGVIPVCFCFLQPDECTESFLFSSLVKHLSLTFARVTQAHQGKAAVHSHLPLSKTTVFLFRHLPGQANVQTLSKV